MLDFVVGLDTEFSELMDGSHLYSPSVGIEEVVLAESKKNLVIDTVRRSYFTEENLYLTLLYLKESRHRHSTPLRELRTQTLELIN